MTSPECHPTVVAVNASPRRGGNTETLVEAALEELERAGCVCTRIALAHLRIHACGAHVDCEERTTCAFADDLPAVLEKVYAADGLILATPVYYEDVSAQMKLFIDRNAFRYYHEDWLTPRVVGLIAVATSSGVEDTLATLRRFVALSDPDEVPVLSMGGLASDIGDAAADAALMAEARALGRAMARHLGLTGA